MRMIDRLIIKAKKRRSLEALTLVIIEENPETKKCVSHCDVYGMDRINAEHENIDAAIEYVNELSEKYPNNEDITIIINDAG